jgi:arylsulfatase A-like enzyme
MRNFLWCVACLWAFPVITLLAAERPNIVLIFADDLGVNDLHCYGREEHQTPHLDQLATQGMKFNCAYTAQPICSPSRAALMTGKCPARLHLTNFLPGRADAPSQKLQQPIIEGQLPVEEVTIAEVLRDAGYATGLFGKWHLGGKGFSPSEQGFQEVVAPPANTPPTATEGGKGEYAITQAALSFIEKHRAEPFFCYIPHNNPHIPLGAKPDLIAKHADTFHPTYAAMIETLDDSIGLLLKKLDELALTERTIVIFTSDNGGLHVLEFPGTPATHNQPYRAGKGYVYEGGLREPLIIRWPGTIAPGSECETPVVLTDLVPTLLEAAGINVGQTVGPLDGVSLLPILKGGSLSERSLYWHFPNYTNQGGRPAGAMRKGDWKLVEHFEEMSVELYDLKADVKEEHNLAAEQPDVVREMVAALHHWREQVGAQMPTPNPEFQADLHTPLYVTQDSSKFVPEKTAALTEPHWQAWREQMNAAVKGRKAVVTPVVGDIRLHAKDARVHGENLRYEPQSHKNVLGYWTKPEDWADWEFEVVAAGKYEVEVQQGCGSTGGSEVLVEVCDQELKFTVQATGHFQHMIQRTIGTVELPLGTCTLAIKPQTKEGVAIMDIRRVVLRPVAAGEVNR